MGVSSVRHCVGEFSGHPTNHPLDLTRRDHRTCIMVVMIQHRRPSRGFRSIGAVVCSVLVLAMVGCGSDDQPDGASGSEPTQPGVSVPIDSAPPASTPGDVVAPQVATFEVAGRETFKILLETQDLVDQAVVMLAEGANSGFPIGDVVRDDPSINAPWSWHIDPASVIFTQMSIEVCDGVPSFVEDRTITSEQYCPWSAVLVDLAPA